MRGRGARRARHPRSNAGIEHFGALAHITPDDFDRVFRTNTRSQLFAAQHAARHLGAEGRIVLTSSVNARKPWLDDTLYGASKAAVEAIVANLAIELGRRGITINAIGPGGTKLTCPPRTTPMRTWT